MKKIFLLISLFSLAFKSGVYAQNPNCFVQVSPLNSTICPGDSVQVTAIANLLGAGQMFNFNGSVLPVGWATTGGTVFTAPCGASPTNTPYYWASTAAAGTYPGISTASFDVACGGVILFDMIYAIQSGASPCEGPDQYNEGVSLQYSLNGGTTWIDIIYYAPNGTTLPANPGVTTPGVNGVTPFTSWNTFTVPIPPGAMTTNTKFRWTTQTTSGTCCDNWGLDNIVINATGAPCGSATVVNWSTGLMDTTTFWISPTTDTNFVALVYDTTGILQCVSAPVNINLFNGNFSFNLPSTANVYCPNASTVVGVTSIVGAGLPVTYSWSNAASSTTPTASISGQGTTPDNIWYYVDVTDNCGYVQTDSVLLNVNQTLAIGTITTNPQINCANNGSASAPVSGNQGVVNYQWYNSAGTQISLTSTTANNPSGWYYVTATDNVCSTNDSVFIPQVLVPFTFNVPDTVTTNCPSVFPIASISALQNAPAPTIVWTNALGMPLPPNNSSGTGYLTYYNLPTTGVAPAFITYNVTVTSCGNSLTKSIVVKVTNINNINFNLPDTVIVNCPLAIAPIQVSNLTGTQGAINYVWSNGTSGATAFSTTLVGSTQDQNQEYVTVSVTDACNFTRTDSVLFITFKLLNITSTTSTPSTSCQPDGSVLATYSGTTGTSNFQWEDSVNYITPGTGDSIQATSWNNIGSGWYYFTITDAVCSDTDSVYVNQLNAPVASFTSDQNDGCSGLYVTFTNTSQNTSYFEWDFGNGNTAIDNTLTSHVEQYITPGTVTLTAYLDATKTCSNSTTLDIGIVVCGCMDANALNYDPAAVVQSGICIYPIPIVVDPNVFSPNGDGNNDLFFFKTTYTVEFKLTITNRWGNVMYDKILDLTAPIGPQGWDGRTPNGAEAKDGTYYYKYTAIGINNDEVTGKGFVQLVRD